MNQNIVKNEKQQVPSGINLNDCDLLNNALTTEKNESNNYSVVLNEMSNDFLYSDLFDIYKETQDFQRKLFNLLFKNGWYELEKAEQNKISQKYNEYNQKYNDIQKKQNS